MKAKPRFDSVRLATLGDLCRKIAGGLPPEAVAKEAVASVRQLFDPDLVLLFVREDDRLLLLAQAAADGISGHQQTPLHVVGECLCGLCAAEKTPIFSEDIRADARCTWDECKKAGFRSFAAMPLLIIDEVTGVLGLAAVDVRDFRKDRELLAVLAAQVAMGLYNARLIKTLEKRAADAQRRLDEQKKIEEDKSVLEAQLRQAQKMEAIGTLAGGIAHDFNNILSGIFGYAELSLMDLPEAGELRNNLVNILQSAERARDLVQQILAFSRQTEHDLSPVSLAPLVKETLKLIRASLPAFIEIRERIETRAKAMADPTQIHQVLMNLYTNAAQAMNETGGMLTVTLSELELSSGFFSHQSDLSAGPYLQLTVSDTGCGMDRAVRERIFDPFFTTKKQNEGTGLGLSVVHGIVRSHGGAVTVESAPGKGSAVSIYLPVVAASEPKTRETPAPVPGGNERILFVDDEAFQVDIARQMLQRLGYRVTVCTTAQEAVERFRSRPEGFDLVVTDMVMPKMTGDTLARELLSIRPELPIILSTGYSDRMSQEKAAAIGIRGFIMKPFIMREIVGEIRRVLGG